MSPKRSWKRVMLASLFGLGLLLVLGWVGLVGLILIWGYVVEIGLHVLESAGLLSGISGGGRFYGIQYGAWAVFLLVAFLVGRVLAWRAPREIRPRALNTFLLSVPWAVVCSWMFLGPLSLYLDPWMTIVAPWQFHPTDLHAAVVWSCTLLGVAWLWPLGWALDAEDRRRRWTGSRPDFPGFDLVRGICRLIWGTLYRLQVQGAGHIPAEGGVLLAANHVSYWDAIFLQVACERPIRWMIDEAYYRLPGLNLLFRWIRCIPVRASHNRAALQAAVEALKAGEVVGIFPEGFLSESGRMRRARTGVSMLSARTGAVVVPAYLRGAFFSWPKGRRAPRLSRVEVRIGEPMSLGRRGDLSREALQGFADRVMGSIRGMFGHGRERRGTPGAGVGGPPSAC